MKFVVGLGNPGTRYAHTRHNVGFMTIEHLSQHWRIGLDQTTPGLRVGTGRIEATPVALLQPLRYMNRSGEALRELPMPWRAEDLIVVHDDIDLPDGQLRVRHDGGSGGHRGVESLIAVCGPEFDRVRVGVGRPADDTEPAEYVLLELGKEELETLRGTAKRAAMAVECLLREGLQRAMNRFNVRAPAQEGQ